ncbi:MAG: hypothetical protein C4538_09415 [Nitrospiraceae bacterium]|nr:MAG: hypothetical protein C4538_09415 [Nitrospiraceae bacterium]
MIYSKSLLIIFFAAIAAILALAPAGANDDITVSEVLESAEKFFLSLKGNDFHNVWRLLTEKSRLTIINDVYKSTRKIGGEITKDEIRKDFENSGMISSNYWRSFLNTFDPDMILKESRWEMVPIKKTTAEIIITHKKSREPAILSLKKENAVWKVGLVETFWTRKTL